MKIRLTGTDWKKLKAQVKVKVDEIAAFARAGKHEDAHVLEDALFEAVLRKIARRIPDPESLANAALRSKKIEFNRWCG